MDAARLIETTREALGAVTDPLEILGEAWQAQALAEAIGQHIAVHGPLELRAEARGLIETGGWAAGALPDTILRTGGIRATRLSELAEARQALLDLGELLDEVGMALVAVACDAHEEWLYWQCIEAIDAADEAGDRIHGLLRRLTVRERMRGDPLADPVAGPP
ncbi:DUF6099 family protein [Streptomyces sp. TP-A0874]|uniref:DUF6099 family protein n=1 Tax=Streptomyces sp. TP-A0874 TaxID=549819 RepID=UPI0008531457|nr:DUF6099 family protein [Streptomyces sp. TP-A0874]